MIDWNEISKESTGGSELMGRRLEETFPEDLQKEFQIILSRVRDLDETKIRILWCHDLPADPESHHLKDGGWCKFHKIVFVSYWQRDAYMREYDIPHSRTVVLHNAIMPIENAPKPTDGIKLIYSTTPHRGLELLVPIVEKLVDKHPDIHLNVYSSFGVYGWKQRDEPYQPLFDRITEHPNMTYHGFQSNIFVREALQDSHIFVYPSIWQETSCLSLIEAMSAGCLCVHSDLAALPETASNWTCMYGYDEDPNQHGSIFYNVLDNAVQMMKNKEEGIMTKLANQKAYVDIFYNWSIRKFQWEALLRSLLDEPREIQEPVGPFFNYQVA